MYRVETKNCDSRAILLLLLLLLAFCLLPAQLDCRTRSGLGFLGMLASRTRSGLGLPPGLVSTNNMVLDVELPAVNCSDVMGFLGFNFSHQICMGALHFTFTSRMVSL